MKTKVAFICIHNSCRSQMAEAWGKYLGRDILESYSAGTEEYHEVKPLAVEAMKEVGISIDNYYLMKIHMVHHAWVSFRD